MELKEFEQRYNKLSDITKKRTAHALENVDITSEEQATTILEMAEQFDILVRLGLAR